MYKLVGHWISWKAWLNLFSVRDENASTYISAQFFLVCSCCVQGNLHDRYGQLVALYTKLLCTKMEFHVKVRASPVVCHATQYVSKMANGKI